MARGWTYIPEHDAWVKTVHFEPVRGWSRRTKLEVAVRRERKGSPIWRVDLFTMVGFEALTPTEHRSAAAAKREADLVLDAFLRARKAGEEVDVQDVAHAIRKSRAT